MEAKDRSTAYVCTNEDGLYKLPMPVIGKSLHPRCFTLFFTRCTYFNQKYPWLDTTTFTRWFNEIFLPLIRKTPSKLVVLLMETYSPHSDNLGENRGPVTMLPFPPNCTLKHLPMDMRVIQAWITQYRKFSLKELLHGIETQSEEVERKKEKSWNEGIGGGLRPLHIRCN